MLLVGMMGVALVSPAASALTDVPTSGPGATDAGDDVAAGGGLSAEATGGGVHAFWLQYVVRRGLLVVIVGSVLAGIWLAHKGKVLPSRDIAGLQAIDEAVARATEMGRPALFTVGGACDLKRVQLFASMPLLRQIARTSGELGNRLIVPVCYPETMSVHINAVKDGYIDAGVMDMFRAEDVRFFPGGQFFFAIAAMGWMLEEKPAACFYFGYWEADSLLFAETGQTIQAMQIAGTDSLFQVPFFVASCDYTLIGEEFWAASAKISRDPHLLGSLGAQDLFKLAVVALIVVGCALCVLGPVRALAAFLQATFR